MVQNKFRSTRDRAKNAKEIRAIIKAYEASGGSEGVNFNSPELHDTAEQLLKFGEVSDIRLFSTNFVEALKDHHYDPKKSVEVARKMSSIPEQGFSQLSDEALLYVAALSKASPFISIEKLPIMVGETKREIVERLGIAAGGVLTAKVVKKMMDENPQVKSTIKRMGKDIAKVGNAVAGSAYKGSAKAAIAGAAVKAMGSSLRQSISKFASDAKTRASYEKRADDISSDNLVDDRRATLANHETQSKVIDRYFTAKDSIPGLESDLKTAKLDLEEAKKAELELSKDEIKKFSDNKRAIESKLAQAKGDVETGKPELKRLGFIKADGTVKTVDVSRLDATTRLKRSQDLDIEKLDKADLDKASRSTVKSGKAYKATIATEQADMRSRIAAHMEAKFPGQKVNSVKEMAKYTMGIDPKNRNYDSNTVRDPELDKIIADKTAMAKRHSVGKAMIETVPERKGNNDYEGNSSQSGSRTDDPDLFKEHDNGPKGGTNNKNTSGKSGAVDSTYKFRMDQIVAKDIYEKAIKDLEVIRNNAAHTINIEKEGATGGPEKLKDAERIHANGELEIKSLRDDISRLQNISAVQLKKKLNKGYVNSYSKGDGIGQVYKNVSSSFITLAGNATDLSKSYANIMKEKANKVVSDVSNSKAGEQVKQTVSDVGEKITDTVKKAKPKVAATFDELVEKIKAKTPNISLSDAIYEAKKRTGNTTKWDDIKHRMGSLKVSAKDRLRKITPDMSAGLDTPDAKVNPDLSADTDVPDNKEPNFSQDANAPKDYQKMRDNWQSQAEIKAELMQDGQLSDAKAEAMSREAYADNTKKAKKLETKFRKANAKRVQKKHGVAPSKVKMALKIGGAGAVVGAASAIANAHNATKDYGNRKGVATNQQVLGVHNAVADYAGDRKKELDDGNYFTKYDDQGNLETAGALRVGKDAAVGAAEGMVGLIPDAIQAWNDTEAINSTNKDSADYKSAAERFASNDYLTQYDENSKSNIFDSDGAFSSLNKWDTRAYQMPEESKYQRAKDLVEITGGNPNGTYEVRKYIDAYDQAKAAGVDLTDEDSVKINLENFLKSDKYVAPDIGPPTKKEAVMAQLYKEKGNALYDMDEATRNNLVTKYASEINPNTEFAPEVKNDPLTGKPVAKSTPMIPDDQIMGPFPPPEKSTSIDQSSGHVIDNDTGYVIDPSTGVLVDPKTGKAAGKRNYTKEDSFAAYDNEYLLGNQEGTELPHDEKSRAKEFLGGNHQGGNDAIYDYLAADRGYLRDDDPRQIAKRNEALSIHQRRVAMNNKNDADKHKAAYTQAQEAQKLDIANTLKQLSPQDRMQYYLQMNKNSQSGQMSQYQQAQMMRGMQQDQYTRDRNAKLDRQSQIAAKRKAFDARNAEITRIAGLPPEQRETELALFTQMQSKNPVHRAFTNQAINTSGADGSWMPWSDGSPSNAYSNPNQKAMEKNWWGGRGVNWNGENDNISSMMDNRLMERDPEFMARLAESRRGTPGMSYGSGFGSGSYFNPKSGYQNSRYDTSEYDSSEYDVDPYLQYKY